jgi:DNA-binding transcriptional ArsR family regulator
MVEPYDISSEKLNSVPEYARKLLAHIVELVHRKHEDARKPGVAYLPEVHESCGLDVDAMYAHLKELEQAGLVVVEGEYPFEEVRVV